MGANVNVIKTGFDDLTRPYMRSVVVSGTGSGTFQIIEEGVLVSYGTMTDGFGIINIDGIPEGDHTFCAIPSSVGACTTFTVGTPLPVNRWGCADGCTAPHVIGDYDSQEGCLADCVIIVPPADVATHVIKFAMADNPYIDYIQQSITTISAQMLDALPFNPNVQYVRTEIDTVGGTIDMYVKYTGAATMGMNRMGCRRTLNRMDRGRITSLTITDDITQYAFDAVLVLSAIVAIATVSLIISTGGWSLAVVAKAIVAGSVIFMLGFTVYNLGTKNVEAQQKITQLEGYKNNTVTKDQSNITLDNAYTECNSKATNDGERKQCCLTLLQGKQTVGLTYADTFSKNFTEMDLKTAKIVFTSCSGSIIDSFNAGTISCDTARANIMDCQDALFNTSDTEFNTKVDPVAPVVAKCPTGCLICDPITTTKCIISTTTAELIGIGLLAYAYLSTRPRETVVIKGG
jgi:hypothetical protein